MGISVEEAIHELRNREEVFVAYSQATRLPYVTCDEETFNDQARIFATEEEIKEYGKQLLEDKIMQPVFTDVMEFEKFGRGKNLRVAKVTIDKLPSLMIPQANAYVVNPMGFNLVLNKEQIEKIAGISK